MGVADDVVVRPLCATDARAVATLHVQVWRDTYAGLMSDEALAALDVEERVVMWRRLLGDSDAPSSLGAFERESGELVGWITVGTARDADAPVQRELWVLNVAARYQGAGVAQVLMDQALDQGPACLWVVKGNDRAVAFYRKHGFEFDGCSRLEDDGASELRMVRPAVEPKG